MSGRGIKADNANDLGDAINRSRNADAQQKQGQEQERQKTLEGLVKNCNALAKELVPMISKRIIDASNRGDLSLSFNNGEFSQLLKEAGSRLGIQAPLHPDFQHAVIAVVLKELNKSLEKQGIQISAQRHDLYEGNFPPDIKLEGFEFAWGSPSALQERRGITPGRRVSTDISEKDISEMLKSIVDIMVREPFPEVQLPTWIGK
jgi:hypothetical protein